MYAESSWVAASTTRCRLRPWSASPLPWVASVRRRLRGWGCGAGVPSGSIAGRPCVSSGTVCGLGAPRSTSIPMS
jgi:hypothetical protein